MVEGRGVRRGTRPAKRAPGHAIVVYWRAMRGARGITSEASQGYSNAGFGGPASRYCGACPFVGYCVVFFVLNKLLSQKKNDRTLILCDPQKSPYFGTIIRAHALKRCTPRMRTRVHSEVCTRTITRDLLGYCRLRRTRLNAGLCSL